MVKRNVQESMDTENSFPYGMNVFEFDFFSLNFQTKCSDPGGMVRSSLDPRGRRVHRQESWRLKFIWVFLSSHLDSKESIMTWLL